MTRLQVRDLRRQAYADAWREMREFTERRDAATPDELWFVEHPPVFTQGRAGRAEHLLAPGDIPVVHIDRGGQVTYHGPGQLLTYTLIDLARRGLGVRRYVRLLEQAVIDVLAGGGVRATRRDAAPGVYIDGAKVAALGLRVRNGCCYHGFAVNLDLDLAPFTRINPCGYAGLPVTRLRDHGVDWDMRELARRLHTALAALLETA